MGRHQRISLVLGGILVAILAVGLRGQEAAAVSPGAYFISQGAILTGLAPGAVFPFIDTTPNRIVQAHIAITDSTNDCHPGAAPPDNIKILVGQAGVAL